VINYYNSLIYSGPCTSLCYGSYPVCPTFSVNSLC